MKKTCICIKQYEKCALILGVYEFDNNEIFSTRSDGTPCKIYSMKLDCVIRDETSYHHFDVNEFDEYFRIIEE